MKTLFFALALLALSTEAHEGPSTEILLGARISQGAVKIRVQSGGCTWKNSFAVKRRLDAASGSTQLTFVRLQPDLCEAYLPQGRVLSFSTQELKIRAGESYTIGNPFSSFTGLE